MPKVFNTAAICIPQEHYMVNLDSRVREIKKLVDAGKYFTINRARQYGKTTTLRALYRNLMKDYYVVSLDFQTFGSAEFETESRFANSFADSILEEFERRYREFPKKMEESLENLRRKISERPLNENFTLRSLFGYLSDLCASADKPIVIMIDEVDSASNNQVF